MTKHFVSQIDTQIVSRITGYKDKESPMQANLKTEKSVIAQTEQRSSGIAENTEKKKDGPISNVTHAAVVDSVPKAQPKLPVIGTYVGVDNKGNECSITIKKAGVDEEGMVILTCTTSYANGGWFSDPKVFVLVPKFQVASDGSHGPGNTDFWSMFEDEYQSKTLNLKLDDDARPVAFSYFDNTGLLRFFMPKKRTCDNLRKFPSWS